MKTGDRNLIYANIALVGALILHNLDHLRQGRALEPAIVVAGTALAAVIIFSLYSSLKRSKDAATISLIVGTTTFFGVIAGHVLPSWGSLSDSYLDVNVDLLSWIAMASEPICGLALAVTAFTVMRRKATAHDDIARAKATG